MVDPPVALVVLELDTEDARGGFASAREFDQALLGACGEDAERVRHGEALNRREIALIRPEP